MNCRYCGNDISIDLDLHYYKLRTLQIAMDMIETENRLKKLKDSLKEIDSRLKSLEMTL